MCMYSLYGRPDEMVKAKVGQTLTKGDFKNHAAFMTDEGTLACIKHGTTLVIENVRLVGAARWIVAKYEGKSMTATFIDATRSSYRRRGYAADCIQLSDDFMMPFHLLADGVTASIPRKVRKDKGVRKPRNLNKVFGLNHVAAILPPDPKPEDEHRDDSKHEQPAEPVNPVKESEPTPAPANS